MDASIRQIRLRLQGIQRALLGQNNDANLIQLHQQLTTMRGHFMQLGLSDRSLLGDIDDAFQQIQQIQAFRSQARPSSPPPTSRRNNQIDQDRLQYLLDLGYTIRRISSEGLLGFKVHHNTIHRFIRRKGMVSQRESYTNLPDADLRLMIADINRRFPNSGVREVLAHLRGLTPRIILQRDKCRRLLAEVDPIGTANRWAQGIQRRQYSVPTPNSLWHIDTHHRIIR